MDLYAVFSAAETEIVDDALTALQQQQLTHYESAGHLFTRQRLQNLYELVVKAIRDRDVSGVVSFTDQVAQERFTSGFDVSEVQAAFNSLENQMWHRIVSTQSPDDLAEAIGLLSTVFGLAKDALARAYVSLASHHHVTSLDLSALFSGTQSPWPLGDEASST
jgi:hypothetical protein